MQTNWRRACEEITGHVNMNVDLVGQYSASLSDDEIGKIFDKLCRLEDNGPRDDFASMYKNMKAIAFHIGLQLVQAKLCQVLYDRAKKQAEVN